MGSKNWRRCCVGKTIVPLGRYTKIMTGKLDANASSIDGNYPFFTCSKEPLRISNYSYNCECVLVAGNGDLNVKYYSGKFDAYQRTYIIESKDSQVLNTKYLFHFLDKYVDKLREQSIGGVIKYIKLGYLTEALLPLPSLSVQKQIADVLDRASDIIEKRKVQIEKLDLLVKSQFIEMFGNPVTNPKGWEIGIIRDLVSEVKYGTSKPAVDNGKYVYLRMNNITYNGSMDYTSLKYIDIDDNEIEKYVVRKGDILFNRTNSKELVGKTAVFKENTPMIIAGYIIRIRVNERANPEYISGYLNSNYGKRILLDMCKAIVGQANINAQELQKIRISITPIQLQNQFANFVSQVEAQKSLLHQSLAKLEQNYKSLMQKCFRGEIF